MANKSIFFILFPSRDMLYLESKLDKLIENYSSEMFDLPQNLESLYREIQHLLKLNKDEQEEFLNKLVSVALPDYSLTKIEYLKVFMLK
jgi:hypothetical protein